nr:hypothetical protein BaRGS_028880 [Batillaria attramentaria]
MATVPVHVHSVSYHYNRSPSNIAFISVTTDDLESSLKFYTQVLGGMQAEEMSFRYHGDDLSWLMFGKEVETARGQGQDPTLLGVPDISYNGTHELIQFSPRGGAASVSGNTHFPAHEPRTSPAYIAAPHICFWVHDDVDFNHYISQLEARAAELGFSKVKVNRPVELGITFSTGDFAGLSFAYFKGPSGEQLELYRIKNQTRHYLGRDYCQRRAVSTAFVTNHTINTWQTKAGVSGRLYGMFQFGTRTDDLWRSVNFYVNELGAHLVQRPLQATNIRGDNVENMLFQKELLDAERQRVQPEELGIANISYTGHMRLDHRFSLFDNYVVETLLYTDGLTLGQPGFNPRLNHSSLGYVNDMYVAIMLDHDLHFLTYLDSLESSLAINGFGHVKVNRSPGQSRKYVTLTNGGLSGMNYAMLSGPAGEHVALVQFRGSSRDRLRRALLQYGSVSTAFPETNPWSTGRMDEFCQQYLGTGLLGK